MLTDRLKKRIPSTKHAGTATLPGYELRFNKRGADGSAKCSIKAERDATVHGIVYDIDPAEKPDLDRIEGPGYKQLAVTLQTQHNSMSAYTYLALDDYVDDILKPYYWYKTLVLEGAIEHGLPGWYIEKIKSVEAMPDPNAKRAQRELSIMD